MNIYKLEIPFQGHDTYNKAVVIAKTPEDAVTIHPNGNSVASNGVWVDRDESLDTSHYAACEWVFADVLSVITCELVGKASKGVKEGTVIVASFNAG